MNILFIGDIVGRPGREATKKGIEKVKKTHKIDIIIANGENMAHGKGVTLKTFNEVKNHVDIFTTGNHTWANDDILTEVEKKDTRLLRPANFPPGNFGTGVQILKKDNYKILVINLIGRTFFKQHYDCPFRAIDGILKEHAKQKFSAIFVDLHAEATSEKIAMKYYVDGRVTVLVGTHTHVPTADAEVTEKGTAYITDVGMVGPKDSVIGAEKNEIIKSFLKQVPFKLEIPSGPCFFNAVVVEIKEHSHGPQAISIVPIHYLFE